MIGSAGRPADNTVSGQALSYRSVAETVAKTGDPLLSIKLSFAFQKIGRFFILKTLLILDLYDGILCLNGKLKSKISADYIQICEHI